ncbi:hypothetical protein H4Q26_011474 [Puccinia striiformis f. sp. tritici PST-130]|nr:hypothetical protein H4Q26_011474 [Puccinia striiformis f. sp. tritici PST-130]
MASIEDSANDQVPLTPPNTSDIPNDVPSSARRESSRIRTPMRHPGFIPTSTDSRRTLVANRNVSSRPARPQLQPTPRTMMVGAMVSSGVVQVSKRTGRQVEVDLSQDSDEENKKAAAAKGPKDKTKDRDGFNHARLYFHPPGEGPKQAADSLAFACRWCPKEYLATDRSTYNLKTHRDGAIFKTSKRLPCTGRAKAIAAGASLPPTAADVISKASKDNPASSGTLIAYTNKGRFDNTTLNRLTVIWMIRQSLPWLRIEDFHLRVMLDYALYNSNLLSRTWAASQAHQLYLQQQGRVIKLIKLTLLMSYVLAQTTDSGSNNFTMAKAVAAKFRATDSTSWDVVNNHHRCACHVLALILGAGLRALKLSTTIVRPKRSDQAFPALETVIEEDEDEVEDDDGEDIEEVFENLSHEEVVDPDDAEAPSAEPGWEIDKDEDEELESDLSGIGFTLKKVIKQLLENESDKYADINTLNQVLKEFLEITKRLEGDGPKLPMVVFEYVRLLDSLEKKKTAALSTTLEPMFYPMIKRTKKYLKFALGCDTVVMATFLHPAWRMQLFTNQSPDQLTRIISLCSRKFLERENQLKSAQPELSHAMTTQSETNFAPEDSDSDAGEFNYYPQNSGSPPVNTEMERYNNGDFPMDRKGAEAMPLVARVAADQTLCFYYPASGCLSLSGRQFTSTESPIHRESFRSPEFFQWLGRSPIGNSSQRPGILSRYRIRWGHERLKKKVTCLFLIMAKSNVDRKPLGEMPVFRRGPGEGTQSSPIIVPSPDGEMRMAMAPDYPQGPEVARSASPPFIPYTAADRAVEDVGFCALHGIQRPISPQYQPARFEEDIPVDPGFDRPSTLLAVLPKTMVVETLYKRTVPRGTYRAGLLVEEPSRFVALATTSEPGYQGVHYHTGRLDRVEPNAEGGFIQANQFRPMSFVDNQFRFQVDSFSDPMSIFFPSSGLQGFPRNGKNPQFKDTDRTDPVFHRPERRQEFVNNHQSGFFTGGIPEANEPNLNAGDAGPPLPETSNGGSTDTSWSTFIAGVHRDIAASLDGFRAEHEVFLKQAQALLDNISQAQSGSSNGAPDPNSAPNESTFCSSRRPAAPPSPGAYPIEEWLYLERDQFLSFNERFRFTYEAPF